tara:strand:+ start:357 stop:911 length:555 start_codon:yes stop_codon:yes gene_type:complete
MKISKEFQTMLDHLALENKKTEAWVAEDPKNRWAGLSPLDPEHWVERGIMSMEALERSDLEIFIYEEHKTAFGCKGRHYDFASMSLEELKKEADYIASAAQEQMRIEAEREARDLDAFKALVQKTIADGAGDENTALRWLTQGETFYHGQCVESWVWDHGILFTDYGRELAKRLMNIVEFKEAA